jgi:hypothetical protein
MSNIPRQIRVSVHGFGEVYALESICFKYLHAIRDAIGIADVETNAASWRYVAKTDADEEGAQIDLLLDRADHCINICEIKFSDKPYVITKSYAQALERKLRVFRARSGRRQNLFLTMITPHRIAPNRYSAVLVANEVVLDDLLAT